MSISSYYSSGFFFFSLLGFCFQPRPPTLYSKPLVTPLIMLDTCEVVVRMAASSLRVPKDFSTRRSWREREREVGGERCRWRWRWR